MEILNTHYKEWLPKIEFVHAKILRKDDTGEIQPMDVAFIEGAISSNSQEEKLKRIREKADKLITIGSCATTGSPSNQRNFFQGKKLEEIEPILQKFKYKEKVLKVSDVVTVNMSINGCPMNETQFIQCMENLLAEKHA